MLSVIKKVYLLDGTKRSSAHVITTHAAPGANAFCGEQ